MYHFDNARRPEQRAHMERLAAEGRCILCDPEPEDVVADARHCNVMVNLYPYDGAVLHLLVAPKLHAVRWADMDQDMHDSVLWGLDWALDKVGVPDYEVRWRSGDPAATGATIEHLHIHVIGRRAPGEPA